MPSGCSRVENGNESGRELEVAVGASCALLGTLLTCASARAGRCAPQRLYVLLRCASRPSAASWPR